MNELLFFSNNKNKILEVTNLFINSSFKVLSLNNFKQIDSPKETGLTFQENAKIKSLYGLNKLKMVCFADDSGICIDAINDNPGVNSKKFLENSDNPKNILEKIIFIAKEQNKFNAFFQSTICLSLTNDDHIFFNGQIHGKISKEIKGAKGFGYDPIFIPDDYNLTFAEMSFEDKNKLSHRAIAIKKLGSYLSDLF